MIETPCIIKVDSEEKSIAVQKILFSMDIIWTTDSTGKVQNTDLPLLHIEHDNFVLKPTITASNLDYLGNNDRYNSWRLYDAEELLYIETIKLL